MAALFNLPWLTESIKKGTIKYLIERYLGHFLSEELDLSQLDIELFNGTASIESIPLNVNTINQEVSSYFPLKFLEGFVNKIEFSVPWSALWTDSCSIQLDGIKLNFCKSQKCTEHDRNQTSILSKSMMASSMEMAEEILQQEPEKYEGLEKFAQLINSIIRRVKLSAKNTVIKFVFPQKSGIGQDIELRIGHIKCEEEEITLDQNKQDNNTKNNNNKSDKNSDIILSDVITKRITLEGIEILINDILITKLYGKHTLKIRFNDNRIDMEAYFGSYIFALLNSDQMKILELFFQMMDDNKSNSKNNDQNENKPKERLMTAQDYHRIKEIWRSETTNKQTNNIMNSSMISLNGGKTWTSDGLQDDEFKPFDQEYSNNNNDKKDNLMSDGHNDTLFTCNIKIPGIILCLMSGNDNDENSDNQMPQFNEIGIIDNLQSFIGINSYLNDILQDYSHIRLLASNLCFEMKCDQLQFSCMNISSYEYHNGILNNLFWVNDKNESDSIMPSIRLKKIKNNLTLTLEPTSIRIDPTIIERHYKLFDFFTSSSLDRQPSTLGHPRSSNSKSDKDDFVLNLDCENIELELLFPIPDLRPERNNYSSLHDEILFIQMKDIGFKIDSDSGELLCSEIQVDMKIDDESKKIFHSHSEQKNIKLYFSTLIPVNISDSTFDENILITEMNSMHESVNFLHSSAINHDKNNEPFQVKRNMFAEESYERIITPGDRDHISHYIAHNRELTKFYTFIHVPYANVYFEDKQMFELIYNRFVNDLILWKPFFPRKPSSKLPELILPMLNEPLTGDDYYDRFDNIDDIRIEYDSNQSHLQNTIFHSCKTNNYADDDESIISDNSYNSYHTTMMDSSNVTLKPQNEFVLEIDFDNLNIDLHTKSGKRNNLFVQNFLMGIIVGPDINPSTVVCLCSENFIIKCDSKQMLISNSQLDLNSQLNVSVEIKRETENFKKIKLAAQLKHATLLGLDIPFLEDFWEFVNVKDDEILGYICPRVTIELHTDIMKSSILFDNLKERTTLIHVEDVYLTSMVVENTNQTILRFFIEEALLCFKRNNYCDDNLRNFISVIDSGIIDINLKISKDGQIEWRGSNNEINLKVCYDSLAALCQFMQSFSASPSKNDADNAQNIDPNLPIDDNVIHSSSSQSSKPTANDILVRKNQSNSNDLIADALSECVQDESVPKDVKNKNDKNCFCENSSMDESNFLILGENDLGSGINTGEEPRIRVLADEPIRIVENHFKITHYDPIPEITPSTIARYLLDRMSLNVYFYAGKDFDDPVEEETSTEKNELKQQNKNNNNNDAISQVNLSLKKEKNKSSSIRSEQKVRFQPSTSSVLWENIDLISTKGYQMNNTLDNHFSFKSLGGTKRKSDTYVVLVLKRIKILFDQFDKQNPTAWLFLFMVEELEIIDKVSVSKINKMLYEYYSESMPRRSYSSMFSIRLNCHRNLQDMLEEADLKVSLKPLRVNIDQDTLFFLVEFFSKFSETLTAKLNSNNNTDLSSPSSINDNYNCKSANNINQKNDTNSLQRFDSKSSINSTHSEEDSYQNDFINNNNDNEEDILYSNASITKNSNDQILLDNNRQRRESTSSTTSCSSNKNNSVDVIFIKSFTFWPDVPIRLDYHGKHIDLKQGALPGIALGLAQLNQSELCLKKLVNKHGLLGIEKVIQYAIEEWGKDIKRNQLPSILGGVGPMHSFIQLFQGIRDLFWIPIDQYRRDQRIVRGIQRGAYAFSVSTAMATLEIANRLVSLIQSTAQFAHDVVTPPTIGGSHRNQMILNSQPRDFREGFTAACAVMRFGFHDTVRGIGNNNLVADDTVTVIGQVVRQIPSRVVRPFIHISAATSNVLVGMRNQLTPEARKDDQEKWKNANEW